MNASVRDHLRDVKRTLTKHIISTPSDSIVTSSQDDSALASVPSPSGERLGVLREISDGSSKKRFVEVWRGDRLEATKEVTKTHEGFHVNRAPFQVVVHIRSNLIILFPATFFSLSFSNSETSFVYTAEAKTSEPSDTSLEAVKSKFRFVPDFGERLTGKKRPALYIFRWDTPTYQDESDNSASEIEEVPQTSATVIALKPSLPEDSSIVFGQASFSPDQKNIFATGYEETFDGRRLGPVGCWNHPSAIYRLDIPSELPSDSDEISVEALRLTPPELSARSPRVTNAASSQPYMTVWLANLIGGPHASCTALHMLRSDEDRSRVLVDCVVDPTHHASFPGLYTDQLPFRPFLSLQADVKGASHLVTHSLWGSRQTVLGISLTSGQVQNLTPEQNMSWTIAGTDGKEGLLATRSTINSPNELVAARFQNLGLSLDWKVIDKPRLTLWGGSAKKSA